MTSTNPSVSPSDYTGRRVRFSAPPTPSAAAWAPSALAPEPVVWPERGKERLRDHAYRWATLLLARLLLPVALLTTFGRSSRRQASEWALTLRFPAERLTGLSPGTKYALVSARTVALWRDHELIGLTSGRRGVAEQQKLFNEAIEEYGSVAEASKWVLPPADSAHVRGTALDVRPFGGARWLDRYGHRYGLHRTFAHEWWHFEYLPDVAYRSAR